MFPRPFIVIFFLPILFNVGCGEVGIEGIGSVDFDGSNNNNQGGGTGQDKSREAHFVGKFAQQQDFLFVVDDSGSMTHELSPGSGTDEITIVRNNLNAFFSVLSSRREVDYQVAVTTTNAKDVEGELFKSDSNYDLFTPNTPDVINEFSSLLQNIAIDVGESWVEQGYHSAQLAITNYGDDFMRPGVSLAVVILSDSTDRSCAVPSGATVNSTTTSNDCELISTNDIIDFFSSQATSILLYPIVATEGNECAGLEGSEGYWDDWGERYRIVQEGVGTGFTGSICSDDLEESLNGVAEDISHHGICYDLPHKAEDTSVVVLVDGVTIEASFEHGFHYRSSTSSVCFGRNYVPKQGSDVWVQYELAD